MDQHYVGLDVHSKQSVFAIADAAGRWVAEGEVPTTPAGLTALRERHALAPQTPVALETGTSAFFVARQLSALGLAPVVVDAHEVRVKAHRPTQKSDRRDARELCEGLRRGIYRVIVQVPSAPVARLRDSLSRRRHFVRVQTAEINAAKRLLRAAGLGQTRCTLRTESGWATRLETLDPSSDLRTYLEQHRALWRCAGEQLRALDHLLVSHQGPFVAELQRLQTIPGVGPIVAATVVAVFADVQRFPDAKHAASYAGLTPSTHQSGARDVHGRITKRGSAELRAMLCEAAHHAARPQHPLHPYFAQQCAKHGYKRAAIAVAHRLCRIMFAMLRHGRDFDVTKLGIEVGPFAHTSVKPYRLKLVPRRQALRAAETRA
jgi:transposase